MSSWDLHDPGVVTLPSGRLLRGRGLRRGAVEGRAPEFGLYLLSSPPVDLDWPTEWIDWPDFRLPRHRTNAIDALRDALERAADVRVELACAGGRGRTGTALAVVAVLDGIEPSEAVRWVREHYHPKAVETPWQRRWIESLRPGVPPGV
jgi:Protein-tyrosine phosphatase